jgi:hypothetical protein
MTTEGSMTRKEQEALGRSIEAANATLRRFADDFGARIRAADERLRADLDGIFLGGQPLRVKVVRNARRPSRSAPRCSTTARR